MTQNLCHFIPQLCSAVDLSYPFPPWNHLEPIQKKRFLSLIPNLLSRRTETQPCCGGLWSRIPHQSGEQSGGFRLQVLASLLQLFHDWRSPVASIPLLQSPLVSFFTQKSDVLNKYPPLSVSPGLPQTSKLRSSAVCSSSAKYILLSTRDVKDIMT